MFKEENGDHSNVDSVLNVCVSVQSTPELIKISLEDLSSNFIIYFLYYISHPKQRKECSVCHRRLRGSEIKVPSITPLIPSD